MTSKSIRNKLKTHAKIHGTQIIYTVLFVCLFELVGMVGNCCLFLFIGVIGDLNEVSGSFGYFVNSLQNVST